MFDYIIFLAYRLVLIPFAIILLKIAKSVLPEKIQTMIEERQDLVLPAMDSRPIWIHASSGEIEYAKSVIRKARAEYPQATILVTYSSPSALKLIKNFPGINFVLPLPWDHRDLVANFLAHIKPQICLIARTDVWPEFSYQLNKLQIPTLLFSATLAQGSSRTGFLARSLTRFALNQLSEIHCVSASDEEEFQKLKISTSLHCHGDTRYDQVYYRLHHPQPLKIQLYPQSQGGLTLVAGSTWPADEAVLLPALKNFFNQKGKLLIAPHEVKEERIQNLEKKFRELGLETLRYSKAEKEWAKEPVMILDQVGHLQEIYTWGDFAFVGGSFKDKVHSVMEPLAAGLPVIVGPLHKNNREALEFQNYSITPELKMVNVAHSEAEMKDLLQYFLKLNSLEAQQTIRSQIQKKLGATTHVLTWIQQHFVKSSD